MWKRKKLVHISLTIKRYGSWLYVKRAGWPQFCRQQKFLPWEVIRMKNLNQNIPGTPCISIYIKLLSFRLPSDFLPTSFRLPSLKICSFVRSYVRPPVQVRSFVCTSPPSSSFVSSFVCSFVCSVVCSFAPIICYADFVMKQFWLHFYFM